MSDIPRDLRVVGSAAIHYVDDKGSYIGGWCEGPPDGAIEVYPPPEYADQVWLFPGWGPSIIAMRNTEDQWRESELVVIANQLDALEEAISGQPPADLLPGSRPEWLAYRGAVRNWKDGSDNYPEKIYRPVMPQ